MICASNGSPHPAESQADHGNSQLELRLHDFIQVVVRFCPVVERCGLQCGGSQVNCWTRSLPEAHQSKFRGCKEGVGCHQEQNEKNPQQHKSNHWGLILTFQKSIVRRFVNPIGARLQPAEGHALLNSDCRPVQTCCFHLAGCIRLKRIAPVPWVRNQVRISGKNSRNKNAHGFVIIQ